MAPCLTWMDFEAYYENVNKCQGHKGVAKMKVRIFVVVIAIMLLAPFSYAVR
jgi:hypothetical protein